MTAALKGRGLSHADAARLLGKSLQTVNNRISLGNFTEKTALEWSTALGIPMETFLPQERQDVGKEIAELKRQIELLTKRLEKLEKR